MKFNEKQRKLFEDVINAKRNSLFIIKEKEGSYFTTLNELKRTTFEEFINLTKNMNSYEVRNVIN